MLYARSQKIVPKHAVHLSAGSRKHVTYYFY